MSENNYSLTDEEKEIEEAIGREDWKPEITTERKEELKKYAKQTQIKDVSITLRISTKNLNSIKAKAIRMGLPYQTLLGSIIHRFANEDLSFE